MVCLRRCLPGRIRRALDELPKTLDETYGRTLEDIDDENWEYAHRLFQCVAAASRPLRVEQLAEFLAFDFDTESTPTFLEDWRPEDPGQAVLYTCSSLLAVVNVDGSQVIQFAHFSVKEYLMSNRLAKAMDKISRFHVSMTAAHTLVTRACLGVLLHLGKDITREVLKMLPLAEYAAEYWVGHARSENVAQHIQDGIKRLFDPTKRHLAIWIWIYDPADPWGDVERSEYPSEAGASALHYAALCGIHDVVKFLVFEHSQDVDARGLDRNATPLILASARGHLEVVRILLECGVDPEIRDRDGYNSLDEASEAGHVEVAQILLEHGADAKAQDNAYWTPLHTASTEAIARVLLEHGGDANAQTKDKRTPLHHSSEVGSVEVTQVLLEHGADANAQCNDYWTPLHEAGIEVVALVLLKHGANPKAQDKYNRTPLHVSSRRGRMEVARVLLEYGADPNAQTKDYSTPLHGAGTEGVAWALLEHGANPNAQDKDNRTPLHVSSEQGRMEVARVLLEYGADPNARDTKNMTSLHLTSREGHLDIVHLLLLCGSDVHAQDNDGQTPFQIASRQGHQDIVWLLLDHGAEN